MIKTIEHLQIKPNVTGKIFHVNLMLVSKLKNYSSSPCVSQNQRHLVADLETNNRFKNVFRIVTSLCIVP